MENKIDQKSKKIIVTGGSGFIGSKLSKKLLDQGYSVCVIDIFPPKKEFALNPNFEFIKLDLSKNKIDTKDILNSYGIVHLAGEGVFQRWTFSAKKRILKSRTQSGENLTDTILKLNPMPSVVVSASAIGFYGNTNDTLVDESNSAGDGFLSTVCREWEGSIIPLGISNTRVVIIRTGTVLGRGGFLGTLHEYVKNGLGFIVGNGKQYVSWVHIDDLVQIYIEAIENSKLAGPVNAVTPNYITQKDFIYTYAKIFKKNIFLRIPKFLLKVFLGERSCLLLDSQKVFPRMLTSINYNYKYPDLKEALEDIENKY